MADPPPLSLFLSLLLLLTSTTFAFTATATATATASSYSYPLIHRFSRHFVPVGAKRSGSGAWIYAPNRSVEYYQTLLASDFQRQRMKLAPQFPFLFPSEGSQTMSLGNNFGWLHYAWIDVGTPRVSFLVALDTGSDLLWLPCDCVQCAPLSATYYNSLDRDLNEYSPSRSSTSKHLSCSHQLCELGPNCKSPKQLCPYNVEYYAENTSSSGVLTEDILHLASDDVAAINSSSVIIGCGMKQTGGYLDGVAPDGLMGLGLKQLSVPSFLAKAGLVADSFSMCFDEDGSGRLYFGDQGPTSQQSTPFLALEGNYTTYFVGVEACCIGGSCLKQSSFKALVDSGTSFTFLPSGVYEEIAQEFDRQVNATISSFEGYQWNYCYKSSSQPKVPSVELMFPLNNSFVIHNPVFMIYGIQGVIGFCLAIQPADGDIGILGHNFMMGYRMVFDRENMKLGWSRSNCEALTDDTTTPVTPNGTGQNPLPSSEQQNTLGGHAVSPAVAGKAPMIPSSASSDVVSSQSRWLNVFSMMLLLHLLPAAL